MCGIYGGINIQSKHNYKILNHRGPDAHGEFRFENVMLGQNRLSIIDLSTKGTQPMSYHKQEGGSNHEFNTQLNYNIAMTFNGEIYNYLEIKEELISLGYKFNTETDTEVIMAAYLEWGSNCVVRFNGMWSLAIYDIDNNKIFCSRDRFGQKPFYYRKEPFMFGSEIKIIEHCTSVKALNKPAIDFFLTLGFIPEPHTIYQEIFKLPAGHNLIYNIKTKEINIKKYYELPSFNPFLNYSSACQELKTVLKDAVKIRLQSDVPTAVFLSGGIDSTIISAICKELKQNITSFSITFTTKHDESTYINIATKHLNIKNEQFVFDESVFKDVLDQYSTMFDEPLADFSLFPTYFLNKNVKQYATVVLSGDGGDEVFGGYPMHWISRIYDLLRTIPSPLRQTLKLLPHQQIKEILRLSSTDVEKYYTQSNITSRLKCTVVDEWITRKFTEAMQIANGSVPEAFRIFDLLHYTLPEKILTKVDRASMASSVEVRSPFLDYRLIELSQKIHTKHKVSFTQGKIILKDSYANQIHNKIIYRKKRGFSPPFKEWFLNQKIDCEKILHELNNKKVISSEMYKQYETKKLQPEYWIRLYLLHTWLEQRDKI